MAELVVLNGAGNIARSVVKSFLTKNIGKYASVKLVDARPYRQSVYQWQSGLTGVRLNKQLARNVESLEISLEGASDVLYFTHDYFTMSSDKNSHLQAVSKITKKLGVKNTVAVCPIELDLAWSEDKSSFYQKAEEAEAIALQQNQKLSLFKTNLVFGAQSHLIHFLIQCSLVGKCPYKNIIQKDQKFLYAPIHSSDVASAVGSALDKHSNGKFILSGSEKLTLRQIMNQVERSADKSEGSTRGPLIPAFDYFWDFTVGTTADLNISRMVDFYESNQNLSEQLSENTWANVSGEQPLIKFTNFYQQQKLLADDYAYPTMAAYKSTHLD